MDFKWSLILIYVLAFDKNDDPCTFLDFDFIVFFFLSLKMIFIIVVTEFEVKEFSSSMIVSLKDTFLLKWLVL